jgi:hypothetical protein
MTRVNAIKKAIDALSEDEYAQLRQWFTEKDWRKWDSEIGADSASGKLDFLVSESLDEKNKGKLRNLFRRIGGEK